MSRAALLRADGGRQGDPLAAAEAIIARATEQGRALSLFERSQLRQHVRRYEADTGETLLAAADRIAARQRGPVMDAADRAALARLLDIGEALMS
jgi:hypothetical protein